MANQDEKTKKFIDEQKKKIVDMIKIQNLDKAGAEQFLGMVKNMIMDNSETAGVTAEMKEQIAKDWPEMQAEILKDF